VIFENRERPLEFTDPMGLEAVWDGDTWVDNYTGELLGRDPNGPGSGGSGGGSGGSGPSESGGSSTTNQHPGWPEPTSDYIREKVAKGQLEWNGSEWVTIGRNGVPLVQPKEEKPAEKPGAAKDAGGNAAGSSSGAASGSGGSASSGGSSSGGTSGGASGGESKPDPSEGNGSSSEVISGGTVSVASQGGGNITTPSEDFLKKLIRQNHIRDTGPNGVGPCYYRSLQAAAEVFAGRNLSLKQINDATTHLRKQNNQWGWPVLSKDWRIGGGNSQSTIIVDALQRLGITNAKVGVYGEKTEGAQFTIRVWEGRHYQLGDANGNLLWEPFEFSGTPRYTGTPDSLIYISISIE